MGYCGESHDRIAMTAPPRLITPERREDDALEASIRPQSLADFVGQEQARANLKVFIDSARARGEALDHVLFVGTARPRQDDACPDRVARDGGRLPLDLGPRHRQGWRPCGHPHQSRGTRRSVHRRDPQAQSGGRGNPLPRDGGFPARSRDRRGAGGALGEDRSCRNSRSSARRPGPASSRRRCATVSAFPSASTSTPSRSSNSS